MKRLLLLSIMGVIGLSMVAQNVTDVSFQIIGNKAVINYSLEKQADIYLYVSTNESEGWNTSFMHWGAYQKTASALRAVKGLADYVTECVKNRSIDLVGKLQTPNIAVSASLKEQWRNIKLR